MGDYGHCLRCGHKLKSKTSKKRGYGPTCFKVSKNLKAKPQLELFDKKKIVDTLKASLKARGIKVL